MGRTTRIASIGLVLVVATAPVAAGGPRKAPKTTRTETVEYAGNAGVALPVGQVSVCVQDSGCLSLTAQKGEEYLGLEIADSSGTPAPFAVTFAGATTHYCGKTETPLWLNGALEIDVSVLAASADCSGVGTTGTLSATFSNRL